MSIRVILADDHEILREGLRLILGQRQDIRIVAEAADGRQAVGQAVDLQPDLVIIDVNMPELNGLDAVRRIRREAPRARVIALSAYADRRYVAGMLEAGALGYVLKANAAEELLAAIDAAMDDRRYLTAEVAEAIADAAEVAATGPTAAGVLGPREREVLQLLAEGHTSPMIARKLFISTRTVDAHRRNIMRKLNLHTIAELTKYALPRGPHQHGPLGAKLGDCADCGHGLWGSYLLQ